MVRRLLNVEGFAVFLLSLYFYYILHGNWLMFMVLLFTPDIFMLGYLVKKSLGATVYNIGHTYVTSAIVLALGLVLQNNLVILGAIILIAHISMDRTIGYGLKYKTNFKNTHLQKV